MKSPLPQTSAPEYVQAAPPRKWAGMFLGAFQAFVLALALVVSVLAGLPWVALAGVGVLTIGALRCRWRGRAHWVDILLAAVCSAVILSTAILSGMLMRTLGSYLDALYAGLASLLACGIALMKQGPTPASVRLRDALVVAWGGTAVALWLAATYLENWKFGFYIGLLAVAGLAVASHWRFHPASVGFHLLNCLVFVAVGLGVADFFVQPAHGIRTSTARRQSYYSYRAARSDPTAFARWWSTYLAEWDKSETELVMPDPEGILPRRLRPNSSSMFFQHRIAVNSLGFRGNEFTRSKGDAYRIIALGESTTFGITLNPEDQPWPEILEQIIQERLRPSRRVQVINAGVPGYQLNDNLHRLNSELLALQPDMIISYHGLNGFPMLDGAFPSTMAAATAPRYRERPLRILANCEYKLRIRQFRQRQVTAFLRHPPVLTDPMKTAYAAAYRRLRDIAATNHVRLALATYSMAVNADSTAEAIEFYQASYPATPWNIPANALHSRIVEQVAREHPEVCYVNTAPGLDGVAEHFLDLVHFSPSGEKRLAATIYAGIEGVLREDLANSLRATKAR